MAVILSSVELRNGDSDEFLARDDQVMEIDHISGQELVSSTLEHLSDDIRIDGQRDLISSLDIV